MEKTSLTFSLSFLYGTLVDGRVAAVKQLSVVSRQGKNQFIAVKSFYIWSGRCNLAPEYAMRGHLTEKADVFGFGVVILEILSGRPNSDSRLDSEKIYLLEWVKKN